MLPELLRGEPGTRVTITLSRPEVASFAASPLPVPGAPSTDLQPPALLQPQSKDDVAGQELATTTPTIAEPTFASVIEIQVPSTSPAHKTHASTLAVPIAPKVMETG